MIHIVSGKPGGGKSYFLVEKVYKELKNRLIFCDMPVYVDNGQGVEVTQKLTRGMLHDFAFPEGCMIAINEGGTWFDSRKSTRAVADEYTFTTEDLMVFSQHRHIDIDMIVVAQDIGMLDLNIRRCAEKYWWVQRFPDYEWYYKLKLPPWFFIRKCYYSESDIMAEHPRVKPFVEIRRFRKKIAKSYDTKYQRNILKNRPRKTYVNWSYEHIDLSNNILSRWMMFPDSQGNKMFCEKKHYDGKMLGVDVWVL